MQEQLSTTEEIEKICKDVHDALLENIEASRSLTRAEVRKRKARYILLKANERMRAIQMDMTSGLNI